MIAEKLESWLVAHCQREGGSELSVRTVRQFGPVRCGEKLRLALSDLESSGKVSVTKQGQKKIVRLIGVATPAGVATQTGVATPAGVATPSVASVATPSVATLDDLTEGEREDFEERAGILEFDASFPRCEAERRSLADVLRRRSS